MKNIVIIFAAILLCSCSTNTKIVGTKQEPVEKIRVYVTPVNNLTPKWYAPQQSTIGTTTPMVTPQIIFQSTNGRGYSGPGAFGGN